VAQFLSQKRGELDLPLAQRLVAHLDAALLEQFLNITLAEGEAVREPENVLDDAQRKPVAVELTIGHGQSDYRDQLARTLLGEASALLLQLPV